MPPKTVKPVSQNATQNDLKKNATTVKQSAFLKALAKYRFNVSRATEMVGIDRKTAYRWKESNSAFRQQWDDLHESLLDSWEECLYKNILKGDTASIIFALKTKGKERGYIEREAANQKAGKILQQAHDGTLTPRDAA